MAKWTLETKFTICNDDRDECIEVSEDPDGLGLIEIRSIVAPWRAGESTQQACFVISEEAVPLLIESLQQMLTAINGRTANGSR